MITGDVLGERARLTPDKTALILVPQGDRVTYAALDDRARRCARMLGDLGLNKGDRVGILAGNRVEYLDAFFAAGKSGFVLVPLATRLTPHELSFIVKDAGLRACLYAGEFRETVCALKATTNVEWWIALDEPADPGDVRYAVGSFSSVRPEAVEGRTAPRASASADVSPEDPYCLLYTSGTTGRPKGVILPHRMIAWNGYNTAIGWQLRDDDVTPVYTPLYHAGGLGVFIVPLFTLGGTIVLHRSFNVSEVWEAIECERCTIVFGVPTIFRMLMEAPEFERVDLGHVRWFISGGAPLPLYIIEAYQRRGVAFKQGYGLTEVGVNCFAMTVEDSIRKAGSIGKPLMFTRARVAAEDGTEAAADEVGELLLKGPHVCRGYWNDPAATAQALDADGWFHTGDLARRDEDGFYYIAGRRKDMFISGGVNVYPAEIEAELLLHPAVQDAAVAGVAHATWGEVGVGFVVLREGHRVDADELNAFLGRRLAKYKLPKEYVFIDALPRTPYGKVVKTELVERYINARTSHE